MAGYRRRVTALIGLVTMAAGVLLGATDASASVVTPPITVPGPILPSQPVVAPQPADLVIMIGGTAAYERNLSVPVGTTFSLAVFDNRLTTGLGWVARISDPGSKVVEALGTKLEDLPCGPSSSGCGSLLYLNFKASSRGTVTIVLERGSADGSVVTNVIRLVVEVR